MSKSTFFQRSVRKWPFIKILQGKKITEIVQNINRIAYIINILF